MIGGLPFHVRDAASGSGRLTDRLVTLAAIVGAHGISGEVRLKLFGEGIAGLQRYAGFQAAGRTLTLKSVRPGPNGAVARFAEIADRNAAEALRGTELAVPRDSLPSLGEGEYYHADLIGRACVDESGEAVGTVVGVENFGAGDIIEIANPAGKRFMLPMIPAAVPDLGDPIVVARAFLI